MEGVKTMLPRANTLPYNSLDEALRDPTVTAALTTLERAYYWSRIYPEFAAVRPKEVQTATIVVYALPYGELDFRNLVDLWIETRRASGDADEAYDYWVRGKALTARTPRWSLLRNVFGFGTH
jgi:ABC-type amino acid transport substrate-binding protein